MFVSQQLQMWRCRETLKLDLHPTRLTRTESIR